jgi:hypothetical protein
MVALIFFLILMLVGIFLWWRCVGKLSEAGRIMFFCSLLAICFGTSPHIPTISDSHGGNGTAHGR